MFRSTDTARPDTVDPVVDLVTLASLAAEGFGYGPYVTSPKDACDVLAGQFGDRVVLDDLGRRAVSRDVARRMFSERAEGERRQREALQQREARLVEEAAHYVPRPGVSIDLPPGVRPVEAMLQAVRDATPRRTSVLEHALSNSDEFTYHPLTGEDDQS